MAKIKKIYKGGVEYEMPKGEKGDTGATGATGATGPQGPQGDSAVYDPSAPDTPDFVMANTTGQSTTKAMTQKAVTDGITSIWPEILDRSIIEPLFNYCGMFVAVGGNTTGRPTAANTTYDGYLIAVEGKNLVGVKGFIPFYDGTLGKFDVGCYSSLPVINDMSNYIGMAEMNAITEGEYSISYPAETKYIIVTLKKAENASESDDVAVFYGEHIKLHYAGVYIVSSPSSQSYKAPTAANSSYDSYLFDVRDRKITNIEGFPPFYDSGIENYDSACYSSLPILGSSSNFIGWASFVSVGTNQYAVNCPEGTKYVIITVKKSDNISTDDDTATFEYSTIKRGVEKMITDMPKNQNYGELVAVDSDLYYQNEAMYVAGTNDNYIGYIYGNLIKYSRTLVKTSIAVGQSKSFVHNILCGYNNAYIYYLWYSVSNSAFRITKIDRSAHTGSVYAELNYTFNSDTLYEMLYDDSGLWLINPADESKVLLFSSSTITSEGIIPSFGTVTDVSHVMKLYIAVPNRIIAKGIASGTTCRIDQSGNVGVVQIPTPIVCYGDSIVGEWWVTNTSEVLYGKLISQKLGLDYDSEVHDVHTTTACKYHLQKDNAEIVGMLSYPGETFSDEYSHNNGCLQSRIDDLLALSPKVLLIMGGTNDFGTNCTLGDLSSVNRSTTMGGLSWILEQILPQLPLCDVFICTPIPRANQNTPNNKGLKLIDYVNGIKQVAEKYGCRIIDMFTDVGIYPINETSQSQVYLRSDLIHPSQLGYAKMSRVLASKLLTFY